ncbi:hypothetical protein [Aquabacterium parvum]|uniref:hypothetical protein n=1 Tax=Aquabacterium parvum TaxID=70584 RepID=UPI000718FE3F|nr:hypothetical protein [Aquabacterium parvum]
MKSIDEARNVLEEAALMTTETVRAFYGIVAAGPDVGTPPWLFILARHIDAWDKASQAYMMAVHQHARPVLNDMERLSASK